MVAIIESYAHALTEPLHLTFFKYFLATVIFCVIAGYLGYILKRKFNENNNRTVFIFGIASAILAVLLLCFFGFAVSALKGMIFSLILFVSSYLDIKTRKVDNYLSVMIVLTALIGIEISDLPGMFLSSTAIAIPVISSAIMTRNRTIGGADIKLSIASALVLDIGKSFFGLALGLILAILVNTLISKKRKSKEAFPLVPYLSIGFITAYFI